jgi:hypothetical protein
MKTFVKTFFQRHDSKVSDRQNKLVVTLSEPLQKLFGQDILHLVFNAQDVDEDSELVTHGSYVINTIYNYLQDRGTKIVSRLEERYAPSKSGLEEKIQIENGTIQSSKIKKEKTLDILFNFKITYLSDEKSEDIVMLGIDRHGTVFDPKHYYTDAVMKNHLIPLQQKGPIELSKKELELRFRECLKAASAQAQEYGRTLQNDIFKRLHRNITRIKGYYTAQIEELHRNHPSYEERRLTIQREYEHKLKEEISNHKLRIVLKLLNYHLIERSEIEMVMKLRSKSFEMPLTAVYDTFTGEMDYGACPSCHANMEKIIMAKDDKIACGHCAFTCSTCKKQYADVQHALSCGVCQNPICAHCVVQCASCQQSVCGAHSHVCAVGNEITCGNCLKHCGVCNMELCGEHTFHCATTHEPVCFEHRVICKGCRKIYSAAYVDQLKKNQKICPDCQTPF